jgi:ABC-type antimicrobial peptide transport system permease subunit
MNYRLHPYALIIGIGIGLMALAALRHPLFAIFLGIVSVIGFDIAFKISAKADDKSSKD